MGLGVVGLGIDFIDYVTGIGVNLGLLCTVRVLLS